MEINPNKPIVDGTTIRNTSFLVNGEDGAPKDEFISPLLGGGIFSDGIDFRTSGWLIANCHAIKGGGAYVKQPSSGSMSRVTFNSNTAAKQGGGIEVEEGSFFAIHASTFSNNRANIAIAPPA